MRMFEAKNPFTKENSSKERSMKKTNTTKQSVNTIKKTINSKVEISKPTKSTHEKPMKVISDFAKSPYKSAVVDQQDYKSVSGLFWSLSKGIENCGLTDKVGIHTVKKEVTLFKK